MGEEERAQAKEMNRIRDIILNEGLKAVGRVNTADLCLVYTALCYEAHTKGTSMSKEEIRAAMKDMVDYIVDNTELILKREIN